MNTPQTVQAQAAAAAPAVDPDRLSILFVDDEPAMLRFIARALEKSPYEVIFAHGPAEALEVLAARPVDVLISDVDMPEMTGLELMQIARRDHSETARILLTGNATMEKVLHAINEGEVTRFFTKPFNAHLFNDAMEVLGERIRRQKREGRSTQEARRDEMNKWLQHRFPGCTEVMRNPEGEVMANIGHLIDSVDAVGIPLLRDLLRREG